MNNKILYVIALMLALVLVGWSFSNGTFRQPANLEFSFKDCDDGVSPYEKSQLGVRGKTWLNDTTLSVKAYVSINCAENITYGTYELNGNNLTLEYKVQSPNTLTKCMCAREVNYKITALDKMEYIIELKRI